MPRVDMEMEKEPLRGEAMSRGSMLSMQLLLALNAALMFVVLLSGWSIYQDVSAKLRTAENIFSNPEQLAPYAEVVIREAATSFILGAVNGSIAQFASDMLRAETYAELATQLNGFSSNVINAFGGTPPASCSDYITCQTNGYVQCSSGKLVYCDYQGQQINCANQSCVAPYVYSVATMVNSVSYLIAQLNGPSQSSNSNAAFSTGLLNVEAIVPWVERQANANDWFDAGLRCKTLTEKVLGVTWNGAYIDFNGNEHRFNVSKDVSRIVGLVDQVCTDLLKLSTSQIEYNKEHY
jgi:hypothetical protein